MKHYLPYFLMAFANILTISAVAQSSKITQNNEINHLIDRMEILYGAESFLHTSTKDLHRDDLVKFVSQKQSQGNFSALDLEDAKYIYRDNNEWLSARVHLDETLKSFDELYKKNYVDTMPPFYTLIEKDLEKKDNNDYTFVNDRPLLGMFYKTPANFWELESDDFYMKINPVINFQVGAGGDQDDIVFQNTRGFELRGAIDDKVYFYTNLYENQQRFRNHIEAKIAQYNSIPGNGFFKEYDSSVSDKINGWDFLNAQGYVGFNISKSIGIELGHGRHFIGNGYNSLLLDNYAHNYFYLKFNTEFWKFKYQNIFAELSAFGQGETLGNLILPKKYMATHYLDFEVNKNISIGLFETVVFSRTDQFELQYLNPLIIYRTVEGFLDSPDNILIGLNGKWNFLNRFQLYGQLILDEFKINELVEGTGWWGNKYGTQIGLKYMNIANIDHLDGQVEFNRVRPYTYAHRDTLESIGNLTTASYSHYNQPLAHPLGANFNELILKLRYQPIHKLIIDGRIIRSNYGADPSANQNFGGDILKSFREIEMDFGNEIGQGNNTDVTLLGLDVSYQFYHNMFAELHLFYRKQDGELDTNDFETKYIGAGIRMNIANQKLDY